MSSSSLLLADFASLPLTERKAFLISLAPTLTHSEWHQLHTHFTSIHRRSYHFDILTSLPVELTLQILSYLPPLELLTHLRPVCKRWNTLLRTPAVCRALTPSPALPASINPVVAFENAISIYNLRLPTYTLDTNYLTAHGSRLAWLNADRTHFSVLNLTTLTLVVSSHRIAPSLEAMNGMRLTADYVLFYNNSTVMYAWGPLSSGEQHMKMRTICLPKPYLLSYANEGEDWIGIDSMALDVASGKLLENNQQDSSTRFFPISLLWEWVTVDRSLRYGLVGVENRLTYSAFYWQSCVVFRGVRSTWEPDERCGVQWRLGGDEPMSNKSWEIG